jgi:hypothetical protein
MKRSLVALCIIGLLVFGVVAEGSTFYPVRLDVVKVFSHAEGYRVVYRKGALDVADVYIPITWFVPGGKAELIKGHDTSYPYLIVYYKDSKFDHVKLFVLSNYKDISWGTLSQDEGRGKFDVQELKIQF